MRSADTISSRPRSDSTAAIKASSGSSPYPATKRAARIMRNGSSENDTSGASGVRSRPDTRSATPP